MDWDVQFVGFSLEVNSNVSGFRDQEVSAVIDVSEGMSTDNDGLGPVGDQSWDVLAKNGFSEDSSVEVVSDATVGTLPHLFEFELFDSGLIGSDGGAFDSDLAVLDGFGSIKSDLVISLVSVLNSEIEILDVEVQERMDQFILNGGPEDSGHFVTVKLSNWVLNLDFL